MRKSAMNNRNACYLNIPILGNKRQVILAVIIQS